jgi:hypothetical protein
MTAQDIHTMPDPRGIGWVNQCDGRILSKHPSKFTAQRRGRELARQIGVDHVVHKLDGSVPEHGHATAKGLARTSGATYSEMREFGTLIGRSILMGTKNVHTTPNPEGTGWVN